MTLVGLSSANVEITRTGAHFCQTLTLDEWQHVGQALEQHDRSLRWVVGDWMLYGSEHFGARAAVIADALNLATGTVANAASVCRRVPIERRRSDLSFFHHEEVAHLPAEQQVRLLDVAAREGLSGSLLRQVVREEAQTRRELKSGDPAEENGKPADDAQPVPPQPAANGHQSPPVRVTLLVTGPVDERVLADGVCRVRDGLEAWLAGHGFSARVDVA